MTRINRKQLASYGGLPKEAAYACQRALANNPDNWGHLSCNPDLDPRIWDVLWGGKRLQADQAKRLVGRKLSRTQRDKVLASEKRVGVINMLIDSNELDRDEQERLLARGTVCAELLQAEWFCEDLRARAAIKAGGIARLRELATAPNERFTDAERREAISTYRSWICDKEYARRARYLRVTFGRWPELGNLVLDDPNPADEMLTALAGSANLDAEQARRLAGMVDGTVSLSASDIINRKYCLLALAANPRCPQDVVDALTRIDGDIGRGALRRAERTSVTTSYRELDDEAQIEWVIARSVYKTGQYGTQQDRPIELLELVDNPHLSEQQRQLVRDNIDDCIEPALVHAYGQTRTSPVDRTPHDEWYEDEFTGAFEGALRLAGERLGSDLARWEVLVGLVDDFDGDFHELVELACNL